LFFNQIHRYALNDTLVGHTGINSGSFIGVFDAFFAAAVRVPTNGNSHS
jgi:hypothetical protein